MWLQLTNPRWAFLFRYLSFLRWLLGMIAFFFSTRFFPFFPSADISSGTKPKSYLLEAFPRRRSFYPSNESVCFWFVLSKTQWHVFYSFGLLKLGFHAIHSALLLSSPKAEHLCLQTDWPAELSLSVSLYVYPNLSVFSLCLFL